MTHYRIPVVASLLAVSDDTVRRWISAGRVVAREDEHGRTVIDGVELARFAREHTASDEADRPASLTSARNRLPGIVTDVRRDLVMAQVEIQAGPHRIVSLISSDAVLELGLEPGVLVTASVKATNVVVERDHES
jgi:molybdopterin-binding protein